MDYIRKLPLLLALTAAIIIGMVGYVRQAANKDNMLNMVVAMAIFYAAGLIIRSTITDIAEEDRIKAEEKEKEAKRIEEEKKSEELSNRMESRSNAGQNIDLTADDNIMNTNTAKELDALPIADFIKNELNK